MCISEKGIQYLKSLKKEAGQFDYFDYVDFFETLDDEDLATHPRKRKIVEEFIANCQAKLEEQEKSKAAWPNFLQRMQAHEKYRSEKMEAMRFIREHYDYKNDQLLFYPRMNKRLATQSGRYWKDADPDLEEPIEEESRILVPNQSSFLTPK